MTLFPNTKRISLARHGKSGVAALLLLSIAVCFSGLPIYRLPAKDRSKPFPCQDNPCGCADAETCWRDCCCNTHAQKLAWAKAHHVTPPAYVVELAKAELAEAKPVAKTRSCCQETKAGNCCKPKTATTCCTKPAAEKKKSSDGRWVTWIGRQKCRGLSPTWLMLGQSIPLAIKIIVPAPEGLCEAIRLPSDSPQTVFQAPDAPPPRVALA